MPDNPVVPAAEIDARPCPYCWSPDEVGCPHGDNMMECDCRPPSGFAEIHEYCAQSVELYLANDDD